MVAGRILSEPVLAAACILAVGLGLSPPARGEEPERGAAPGGSRLVLRYRQPARAWTEALPIGNGRLGGMVFGGTASERIALNEDTVWAGERRDRTNPEALANLPTVRRLLLDGKPAEAEALAERTMIARPKRLPPYQPLGDLRIRMPGHESVERLPPRARPGPRDRPGDLPRGRRRLPPRGLRLGRGPGPGRALSCDRPGRISFSATLGRDQDGRVEAVGPIARSCAARRSAGRAAPRREQGGRPVRGDPPGHPGGRPGPDRGGSRRGPRCRRGDPPARRRDRLPTSRPGRGRTTHPGRRPAALRSARGQAVRDHRALFGRVELEIGDDRPGDADDPADRPTDERLRRVRRGEADAELAALYFQFGRYLLIASSRARRACRPTCRGSGTTSLSAAVGEQVHDQHQHRDELLAGRDGQPRRVPRAAVRPDRAHARQTGRRDRAGHVRRRGFVVHHNTDLWATPRRSTAGSRASGRWAAPGSAAPVGALRTSAGDRAVPRSRLSDHEGGRAVLPRLPGRGCRRPAGRRARRSRRKTVYRLPTAEGHALHGPDDGHRDPPRSCSRRTVEAAEMLGVDADFRERAGRGPRRACRRSRSANTASCRSGSRTTTTRAGPPPHLAPVRASIPGDQIIAARHARDFAAAARRSLERRLAHGGGHTGWSRAWIINLWARLGDGDTGPRAPRSRLLAPDRRCPTCSTPTRPSRSTAISAAPPASPRCCCRATPARSTCCPPCPRPGPPGRPRPARPRRLRGRPRLGRGAPPVTSAQLAASMAGEHRIRPPKGRRIAAIRAGGESVPIRPNEDGTVSLAVGAEKTYAIAFR